MDGRNIRVEHVSSEGQYERLPGLAADLVRLKVDVIVAPAAQNVLAAKQATGTIPMSASATRWAMGSSPVSLGPAGTSPARPF